jgi:hypothetical protein
MPLAPAWPRRIAQVVLFWFSWARKQADLLQLAFITLVKRKGFFLSKAHTISSKGNCSLSTWYYYPQLSWAASPPASSLVKSHGQVFVLNGSFLNDSLLCHTEGFCCKSVLWIFWKGWFSFYCFELGPFSALFMSGKYVLKEGAEKLKGFSSSQFIQLDLWSIQ